MKDPAWERMKAAFLGFGHTQIPSPVTAHRQKCVFNGDFTEDKDSANLLSSGTVFQRVGALTEKVKGHLWCSALNLGWHAEPWLRTSGHVRTGGIIKVSGSTSKVWSGSLAAVFWTSCNLTLRHVYKGSQQSTCEEIKA